MGKYVTGNLLRDEKIVYESKLHWIVFMNRLFVISILLFILSFFFEGNDITSIVITLAVVFLVISVMYALIRLWTSEFAITNKRIVIKVGLIRRNTLEMNLIKIESVAVDQSILGRILNFGSLTITGTGATKQTHKSIDNPIQFRKVYQEQI